MTRTSYHRSGVLLSTLSIALAGTSACGDLEDARTADVWSVQSALTDFAALPAFPHLSGPVDIWNVNSGKCLQTVGTIGGTFVEQASCTGSKSQAWFFITAVNGSGGVQYQIRPGSGVWQNLAVEGGGTTNGTHINITGSIAGNNLFHLADTGRGVYEIRTPAGKCIDIPNGSVDDAVFAQQYDCIGVNNERWVIQPRTLNYNLINKASTKCMRVANAGLGDNAAVEQGTCAEALKDQRWQLSDAGMDSGVQRYYVIDANSGKCLDVPNGSTADGVPLQQYSCIGVNNEKWAFEAVSDGRVRIRNMNSDKCIDLGTSATLRQMPCGNGDSQRWYYTNYVRRHVELVQVANDDGSDLATVTDSEASNLVSWANGIYRPFGSELVFTASTDRVTMKSTCLHNLADGDSVSAGCASSAALQYPGKVVVFTRKNGNGFSYGRWLVIGNPATSAPVCGGTPPAVPNVRWVAHEFGHYMGLQHPGPGENDQLPDTRPDPGLDECLATHTPTGTQGGVTVDTNNIMSYYYNANHVITPGQAAVVRASSYYYFY